MQAATVTHYVRPERRIFERFRFTEDALLVAENLVGIVRQVSFGALSFQYKDRGQFEPGSDLEVVTSLHNFSFKAGEYKVLPKRRISVAGGVQLATCCISLAGLGEAKMREFLSFMRKNCLEKIPTPRFERTPRPLLAMRRPVEAVSTFKMPKMKVSVNCDKQIGIM